MHDNVFLVCGNVGNMCEMPTFPHIFFCNPVQYSIFDRV